MTKDDSDLDDESEIFNFKSMDLGQDYDPE